MESTYISEEVRGQVAALEGREKALIARVKGLWPVAGGLCVAMVVSGLLASYLGPDAYPSKIDVPAQILSMFPEETLSSSSVVGAGIGKIASTIESHLFKVIPFMLLGAILLGGLKAMFTTGDSGLIKALAGITALVMAASITFAFHDGEREISPRSAFLKAVNEYRLGDVVRSFEKVFPPGKDSSPAELYVLAQIALADEKSKHPWFKLDSELATKVASPSAGFMPTGEALYAIERAAYGAAKSPAAVAYQEKSLSRKRWAQIANLVLAGLCAAVIGVGLVILALKQAIGRRVRRIRGLLQG